MVYYWGIQALLYSFVQQLLPLKLHQSYPVLIGNIPARNNFLSATIRFEKNRKILSSVKMRILVSMSLSDGRGRHQISIQICEKLVAQMDATKTYYDWYNYKHSLMNFKEDNIIQYNMHKLCTCYTQLTHQCIYLLLACEHVFSMNNGFWCMLLPLFPIALFYYVN